jgi:hypothetical protein
MMKNVLQCLLLELAEQQKNKTTATKLDALVGFVNLPLMGLATCIKHETFLVIGTKKLFLPLN